MGCYDYLKFKCPNCGKTSEEIQTKVLGDEALETFEINSTVNAPDCIMLLKSPCEHCGKRVAVEILGGKISSFKQEDHATCEEITWGLVVSLPRYQNGKEQI